MSEGETRQEPEIISTGMFYDKVTGTDASKPVKKQRLEIVQVGLNTSNLKARDPEGNFVELGSVQLVDALKTLRRTVPDNLGTGVGQYYDTKASKFRRKYMPRKR